MVNACINFMIIDCSKSYIGGTDCLLVILLAGFLLPSDPAALAAGLGAQPRSPQS